MNVYRNIDNIKQGKLFVTAGIFDGLHLGHRHILGELVKAAKAHQKQSAVITFSPHPLTVVRKNMNVFLIDTLAEKIKLIEKQGIDNLIIIPFTKEFASLTAKEFMQQYLKQKLDISGLLVGYDHKFGKDKMHDFNTLSKYAQECDFSIKKTKVFNYENETISSTLIRKAILEGNIERVNAFLSRPYELSGIVVEGRKLGRQIGFPTANIDTQEPHKIIPKVGVYAVQVYYNNLVINGMLNIGMRPTFDDGFTHKTVEVYLFDFDGDLYGDTLRVTFHKRIRDEVKFAQISDLIDQLQQDESTIREYFAKGKNKKTVEINRIVAAKV